MLTKIQTYSLRYCKIVRERECSAGFGVVRARDNCVGGMDQSVCRVPFGSANQDIQQFLVHFLIHHRHYHHDLIFVKAGIP